jgi:hypothetical protein
VSYYRFGPDDVIRNVVKTNPTVNFYIYGGVVYFNNRTTKDHFPRVTKTMCPPDMLVCMR